MCRDKLSGKSTEISDIKSFFYSGEKEDIVIGFEEQQITQVVDWFGTEENGLFECLGTYYMEKQKRERHLRSK